MGASISTGSEDRVAMAAACTACPITSRGNSSNSQRKGRGRTRMFRVYQAWPCQDWRWRRASNSETPVATETFRLSTVPPIGILAR